MALKFKKNDHVVVIAGSNKGKTGNIISVKDNRVFISNVNLVNYRKQSATDSSKEVLKKEASIHISNISHIENGAPVKISFKIESTGSKNFSSKTRLSKKTKKKID